jgi:two-component system, OmpR family, aerobic respiration control sensor histidine kinase ArcB
MKIRNYDHSVIKDEIVSSYRLYQKYYFQDRNLDAVLSLFSPSITNIGSGQDEMTMDYDSVAYIFRRDIEQCPDSIFYNEHFLDITVLNENMGLMIASFDLHGIINGQPFSNYYRTSMVWEKPDEKWLIRHIHFSVGEPGLQAGESYPLKEIEKKNQILENLVRQRTSDLINLNIELSEANKEISEIKQRFETIFEKASDGIIVADWKTRGFFMINQRICDILGFKKRDLDKMWFSNIIPGESLEASLGKILQESNGDKLIADDIPFTCSNGEVRYFDITSQPIKINHKNYLVSLCRDITDHKKSVYLRHQAEIAQKASEAKNIFLANMSHEIRTPVTGIMGMSEILSKTPLTSEQSEYLNIITESSRVLLALINDILDISKIEAGKLVLRQERLKISDLVSTIKVITHASLINSGNSLQINIAGDVPDYIFADKMRLEQIIMNLLNNALKFTCNGQITLNISKLTLAHREEITISITDTGIGINQESQSMLFQKFQQVDNSLSRPADGSGLGLYICRELVNLMNGKIGVRSKVGEGSTFWFSFPLNQISSVYEEEKPQINSDLPLDLNVLVVDDKRINLQVISLMLKSAGCTVETASTGMDALKICEKTHYDVILMDIMMPMMDGITTMKELRKKHRNLSPVIAITANAMSGDKEKYIAEGFNGYITKPLTLDKLVFELKTIKMFNSNKMADLNQL